MAEPRIVYLKPKIGATLNFIEADAVEVEKTAEKSAAIAAVLPSCRSDVESCVTALAAQPDPDSAVEMDGLLSLPLPYLSKHQNGGGGVSPHLLCQADDVTPPPSFSRLPPDGHEFPPNYIEPGPGSDKLILTSTTDQRRSPKWRQDEKSQRSVRDKIALFSTEKSEEMCDVLLPTAVPTCPPPPPPSNNVLNRFRSTEELSLRHNGAMIMERAVSTIDLSPQDCAPTSLTLPPSVPSTVPRSGYSTLPRKPVAVPAAPMTMGLGRTLSFTGVSPALHTRSQSLIDVAGPRKTPSSSISALLEQRSRGMSKLRGLVIPERGEVPVGAVVDLPEIRSRDIPLLKPAVRPTSLQESVGTRGGVFSNNKTGNSLLPALPTMPKYSPAFKRKTFSLFGNKDQEISTTTKINQPIKPIEAYNKSFNQYYSKSGDTNGLSFVSTISEPKSLESLSSPRSDVSFDELPPRGPPSEDGDSDSAVSSGRSSPPDAHHGDEPRRSSLRRTLSSETASSTASTASSTLTSGSDGCGRRVLKAQSVEAVNRKNVLASARHSNGRPVLGSPLIQRRFDDDDDSSGHFEMHASEEAYYSATTELENEPKPYVVHSILNGINESIGESEEREIKVAYVDEICELEFMPPSEVAPPVSPRKMVPEIVAPVVSPRKLPVEVTQAPMSPPPAAPLRVTELRAKAVNAPEPPSSAPPPLPVEAAPLCRPTAPPRPPPVVAPRTPPPAPPTEEEPESPPPTADSVDGVEEKPNKERWNRLERKYETPTTARNSSPRSSRQEEVKSFRDIAERWQLMSVDAPAPKAPQTTPQTAPKSSPEKPGRRSSSVTDIRRAFEKSPAASAVLTAAPPAHARVSSLDSSASEETGGSPSTPASALLSSANSLEQLGSISSLASSTSLISQQELQSLLDEAAGLEEGQGEMLVLVLHRDSVPSSVGITLAGGADYEARDITVHKVLAGSPADRDGRVQKGDRILSINGRSMKNLTHREALTILKAPRPEVVLVLSRGRSDPTSEEGAPAPARPAAPAQQEAPETAASSPGAATLVTMTKDGAGLGFSLEGGRDSPLGDRPLVIKKIFTGGAAEKTGQLSAGDQLLAVNGSDVSAMSRIEAWTLMKRLPLGSVTLLVRPRAA